MSSAERSLQSLQDLTGTKNIPGSWYRVEQKQINQFADVSLDHNYIHTDPELAAESPFKATIAHGFLTLSLISYLIRSIPWIKELFEESVMTINYGLDRVRFISPVKAGSRIRARSKVLEAKLKDSQTLFLKQKVTVEAEGKDKPVCEAVWILHLIFSENE